MTIKELKTIIKIEDNEEIEFIVRQQDKNKKHYLCGGDLKFVANAFDKNYGAKCQKCHNIKLLTLLE